MAQLKFITIITLLLTIGCEGPQGPMGDSGKNAEILYSNIYGNVVLYNSSTSPVAKPDSVTVELEGTNYSTLTDTLGRYKLTHVKTGTYNVIAKKKGYGLSKYFGFQVVGGGDIEGWSTTLGAIPAFTIIDYAVTKSAMTKSITIKGNFSGPALSSVYGISTFISKNSNVSGDPDTQSFFIGRAFYNSSSTGFAFTYNLWTALNFASNDSIYIITYPIGNYITSYDDIKTGYTHYTNLGTPSSIVGLTLP